MPKKQVKKQPQPQAFNEYGEPIYNLDGSPRKRMGRPSKVDKIDKRAFEELCKIQCTIEEICAVLDVSPKVLEEFCKRNYDGLTFHKVFGIKRCAGKASLRRSQFKMSESNPTMAIWLGKQYLGQSDNPQNYDDTKIEEDAISKSLRELGEGL